MVFLLVLGVTNKPVLEEVAVDRVGVVVEACFAPLVVMEASSVASWARVAGPLQVLPLVTCTANNTQLMLLLA